jgi:hypothetical protein
MAKATGKSKSKSRRSKQKEAQPAATQTPQAGAQLAGEGRGVFNAYVIRAGQTKHGARTEFGQAEFVQTAIADLFPNGLPKHVNHSGLFRDVEGSLNRNPDYRAAGHRSLHRTTVLRVLRTMREANS